MIKYKNYNNINQSNYMELDYKFLTLLKLVKQCHDSASWGDHVFVEKLISKVVDLDSIPDWLEIESDLLKEVANS
tara:strand:- start:1122 stop:1346 length:225 start_codon:yes stop_codon:yes gene_type:complete